jgi:hypothetical protein
MGRKHDDVKEGTPAELGMVLVETLAEGAILHYRTSDGMNIHLTNTEPKPLKVRMGLWRGNTKFLQQLLR